MARDPDCGDTCTALLVSLNMAGQYSLALPLLKGYAEADPDLREAVAIRVLDLPITDGAAKLEKRLVAEVGSWNPRVIGLSCNIWNATLVRQACGWLRRECPDAVIVLGGQEICPPIEEITALYPEADILVEGEGEGPFRGVLRALVMGDGRDLSSVAGIHHRTAAGGWVSTGPADRIVDLASIPSPYLTGNLAPPKDARYGCMVEITRGCPKRCAYCFEAERYDASSSFPLERVEEELRFLLERGYDRFHFLDPILYHGGRLSALHDMLSRLDLKDATFFVELYADRIRREDLPYLDFVDSCDLGIQTLSERAGRIIRRPFHEERFLEGYHLLREAGKSINIHLLFGLPGDTFETFRRAVKFALDLQPDYVIFNRLNVLRGTPLRRDAERYGLKYDEKPPYHILSCDTFSAEDVRRACELRDTVSAVFFPEIEYRD